MMMKCEMLPALSLVIALTGCGLSDEPRPEAVMSVNCDNAFNGAATISLDEIRSKTGASEVVIDITDQKQRKSLTVNLVGRIAVDEYQILPSFAGVQILKLPTAVLVAGVPDPASDVYYAGDKGFTLKCIGAKVADIRSNGN